MRPPGTAQSRLPDTPGLETAFSPTLSGLLDDAASFLDSGVMQRLFSSFARGAPGAGLLLMRAATGGALIACACAALAAGPALRTVALHVASAGIGCLLLVGLWTPVAATLAALVAAIGAFSHPAEPGFYLLLATLGAALALLGPGAWSIDSRLFGWKRFEIRDPKERETPPD